MLEILEKIHNRNNTIILYHNVGEIYFNMENYEEAEKYFIKEKALAEELNDKLWIAMSLFQTGGVNLHFHKDYPKALENATTAYEMMEVNPGANSIDKIGPLLLLSDIYLDGYNDYANAEKYALLALKYAEELNQPFEMSGALSQLANIYLHKGMYSESEQTALKALNVDSTRSDYHIMLFNLLAKSSAFLGKPKQAAEYLDRYTALTSERSSKNYVRSHGNSNQIRNRKERKYHRQAKYATQIAGRRRGRFYYDSCPAVVYTPPAQPPQSRPCRNERHERQVFGLIDKIQANFG